MVFIFVLGTVHTQEKDSDFLVLKDPYLGQKPPGMKPELFVPGIITTRFHGHSAPTVSPFGDEIMAVKIKSKFLNEERTIHIHLPPEYHESGDKFPVLVLLDGEWSFEKFKPVVKSLIQERKIPEMIIAGIENISQDTRLRDFTKENIVMVQLFVLYVIFKFSLKMNVNTNCQLRIDNC